MFLYGQYNLPIHYLHAAWNQKFLCYYVCKIRITTWWLTECRVDHNPLIFSPKFIMQVAMNSLCVYAFRLFWKSSILAIWKIHVISYHTMRKIRPSGMNIERREKRISPLKNKERPKSHNSFTEKIEMMVKRKKRLTFFNITTRKWSHAQTSKNVQNVGLFFSVYLVLQRIMRRETPLKTDK